MATAPLLQIFGTAVNVAGARLTAGSIFMVLLFGLFWYVLNWTAWGRHVYALGDDPDAARLVGSEGKIYAFEVEAENSKRILEHGQMNSLPQIELVQTAVWSECTTLFFRPDSDSSGRKTGAVSRNQGNHEGPAVSVVEDVTLDHFALKHKLPDVVKIDGEGAEETS